MKMPEKIADSMFAPCGMNCFVCYKHCNAKTVCFGCLESDAGKPGHCRECKIKECIRNKGLKYCYECPEFPCRQIKSLDKSYKTRYGASLIQNSLTVKEKGVTDFMSRQVILYACPQCGGVISLHDAECSECNAPTENQN